jgi:hypothetical protein
MQLLQPHINPPLVFVGVKLIASIARKHLIEEKVGLLPT